MESYPLVAIVVPVHNNKEYTLKYLRSITQLAYPNIKVIVVDDGSTDGTEEGIKKEYPDVILLKGDGSLWWSGANNLGIKKAIELNAEYVFWGDNDSVIDTQSISFLVDTAEKNPRSIVTSKVYYLDAPQRIQQAGWEKPPGRKHTIKRTGCGEIDHGQYDTQRDVPCATMGVLVNASFFKELGMFDSKNMPQYGADSDFAFRAVKKGYRIIYEPRSKVWHKEMTTTQSLTLPSKSFLSNLIYLATNPRSTRYFRMNMIFMFRHSPWYRWPRYLAAYIYDVVTRSMKQ